MPHAALECNSSGTPAVLSVVHAASEMTRLPSFSRSTDPGAGHDPRMVQVQMGQRYRAGRMVHAWGKPCPSKAFVALLCVPLGHIGRYTWAHSTMKQPVCGVGASGVWHASLMLLAVPDCSETLGDVDICASLLYLPSYEAWGHSEKDGLGHWSDHRIQLSSARHFHEQCLLLGVWSTASLRRCFVLTASPAKNGTFCSRV